MSPDCLVQAAGEVESYCVWWVLSHQGVEVFVAYRLGDLIDEDRQSPSRLVVRSRWPATSAGFNSQPRKVRTSPRTFLETVTSTWSPS